MNHSAIRLSTRPLDVLPESYTSAVLAGGARAREAQRAVEAYRLRDHGRERWSYARIGALLGCSRHQARKLVGRGRFLARSPRS